MTDTDDITDLPVFDPPEVDRPDMSAAFAAQSDNPIAELDDREV